MSETFTGKVWVLGDDIDTDIIIPTEYLALKTVRGYETLRIFSAAPGTGRTDSNQATSSLQARTLAADPPENRLRKIIKALGIQCVIAKSFARIFFRNSINNGLLLIENPDLHDAVKEGDTIEVTVETPVSITTVRPSRSLLFRRIWWRSSMPADWSRPCATVTDWTDLQEVQYIWVQQSLKKSFVKIQGIAVRQSRRYRNRKRGPCDDPRYLYPVCCRKI